MSTKGGFKVLVNGHVRRCTKITADFDDASLQLDGGKTEDFVRAGFAVMSITEDDSPDKIEIS
jgi:hypothetical protein